MKGLRYIRMDIKEIDVIARNHMGSAQYKDCWRVFVNVTLNLPVP